jgi:hypothetical protein
LKPVETTKQKDSFHSNCVCVCQPFTVSQAIKKLIQQFSAVGLDKSGTGNRASTFRLKVGPTDKIRFTIWAFSWVFHRKVWQLLKLHGVHLSVTLMSFHSNKNADQRCRSKSQEWDQFQSASVQDVILEPSSPELAPLKDRRGWDLNVLCWGLDLHDHLLHAISVRLI